MIIQNSLISKFTIAKSSPKDSYFFVGVHRLASGHSQIWKEKGIQILSTENNLKMITYFQSSLISHFPKVKSSHNDINFCFKVHCIADYRKKIK